MEITRQTPDTVRPVGRVAPQVVRCECSVCGAHTNAVKTFRITGSCANCGSFDLTPLEGTAPVVGPFAA